MALLCLDVGIGDGTRRRAQRNVSRVTFIPMFMRFDPDVLRRLNHRAASTRGVTASGLAERLIDEGLRMAEHPGIVFNDGVHGRYAALASGPAIHEVVSIARDVRTPGRDPADAVAQIMGLSTASVHTALRYYDAYSAEIDAQLSATPADPAGLQHT